MPRAQCEGGNCGHEAEVYAIDPDPGGWGGRYCEECCKALGFVVVDRLAQRLKRTEDDANV
jgi:hypothetical protein